MAFEDAAGRIANGEQRTHFGETGKGGYDPLPPARMTAMQYDGRVAI